MASLPPIGAKRRDKINIVILSFHKILDDVVMFYGNTKLLSSAKWVWPMNLHHLNQFPNDEAVLV